MYLYINFLCIHNALLLILKNIVNCTVSLKNLFLTLSNKYDYLSTPEPSPPKHPHRRILTAPQ